MEAVVGIDLGTSNSAVAAVVDGVPAVIPGRNGYRLVPSVVARAHTGRILVGVLARRQAVTNPLQTVMAAKRLIGRRWNDPEAVEARRRMPCRMEPGPHDDVHVRLGDRSLSIPEVCAMILSELRRDAEAHLGMPVSRAVITVPAHFGDAQRQATIDAGRIAGLEVVRVVNEPTAAALAYGFGRGGDRRVAVFDLGGGTFDVSILRVSAGVFDVLATGGDTALGGDDFDQRLVDVLAEGFQAEHRVDLRRDPMALLRLRDAAEGAKCALSSAASAEVSLPFVATGPRGPLHLQRTVSRVEFERLVADLVERCAAVCAATLERSGLDASHVDEVVLVGGMSRMPAVAEAARRVFDREPARHVHPQEVVAMGAAVEAVALAGQTPGAVLLDVTPHALGIGIVGGLVDVLIPANSRLPVSVRRVFTTVRDHQPTARIRVLQGESPDVSGNEMLGEIVLEGLERSARGEATIEVTFQIGVDGVVDVAARDGATGRQKSLRLAASNRLTAEEVKAAQARAAEAEVAPAGHGLSPQLHARAVRMLADLAETVQRLPSGARNRFGPALMGAQQAAHEVRRAVSKADVELLGPALERLEVSLQVLRSFVKE